MLARHRAAATQMPLLMPWSQFTKGALPGSSRAVVDRFLAVPHGIRVTFNSNLKCLGHYSQKGPSRAVPGQFFAFFRRLARDPVGPRPGAVHFFSPRAGPWSLLILN